MGVLTVLVLWVPVALFSKCAEVGGRAIAVVMYLTVAPVMSLCLSTLAMCVTLFDIWSTAFLLLPLA